MLKESITTQETVKLLNEALMLDKNAIREIFIPHVECNEALAYHGAIDCYTDNNGRYFFGLLGLINGFFGISPYGCGSITVSATQTEILEFVELNYENRHVKKDSITVEEVIDVLNDALSRDRYAVEKLFFDRKECNDALASHKTIQVGLFKGMNKVGALGLINGMFGIDKNGYGAIMMEMNEGIIIKFKKVKEGIDYGIER